MAKQSALKVPTGLSPEKQAKVDAILKKYEEQNRQIEREHAKEMAKLYGGAALQIGSAFIPGTLGLKLAGGAIKGLAPVVGRKIAQNVATGVTSGLASGAVEGLGRGLMENQNPLKTMATDSLAGGLLGGLGGYGLGKVAQKLNTQTAWHGSPYKFDKFSNEAIGTGEGAQAHGYGHYAAKSKDVAEKRYAYNPTRVVYEGKATPDIQKHPDLFDDILTKGKESVRNKYLEDLELMKDLSVKYPDIDDYDRLINHAQNRLNIIDNVDESKLSRGEKGFVYKLSIPKDDMMLREDLPFSQQSPKVQEALKNLGKTYNDLFDNNEIITNIEYFPNTTRGKDIYGSLMRDLGDEVAVSDELYHNGIKGISYNGGIDGEANVIFNPDDIDIIPYYDNPTSFKEKFINLLNR